MKRKQRSFLKWAGGKYSSLPYILSALPAGTRLVEPFLGSGVVFLNTKYNQYLLGEKNSDLVLLCCYLQQEGEDFIQYCQQFFTKETHSKQAYYDFRMQFNQAPPGQLRAALFLYLNKHGYNGLCRYNRKGGFNVPFGSYERVRFPQKALLEFAKKSFDAQFIHSDFRATFDKVREGDVIYCDPPYVPLSDSANFVSYTQEYFQAQDQEDLAMLARKAVKEKGVTVLISNHDTAYTRELYQGSELTSFFVRRSISSNGQKRLPVSELLAVFVP